MKIEQSILNSVKEFLINPIYAKVFIENDLLECKEFLELSPMQKANHLYFVLDCKFNTELYVQERRILYSNDNVDILVYFFQYFDIIEEVLVLCKQRIVDFNSFERLYFKIRPEKDAEDFEKHNITSTDQFLFYVVSKKLIPLIIQLKNRAKTLLKKYEINVNYKSEEKLKIIRSFRQKEKIYFKNFELLAALIAHETKENNVTLELRRVPSNEEIFEYINEHFWIGNKSRKGKPMKLKTMISYYSDRNGFNYNLDKFEKYLKAIESVLKSVD